MPKLSSWGGVGFFFGLFAVVSGWWGCSSGPSADQACTLSAAATCAKIDQCIKNGVVNRYGDLATCQARQKQSCLSALTASATGNTPTFVETCAATIPGASCSDYESALVTECAPKMGTLALGAACAYAAQCASSVCAITKGTNCGVCAAASNAGDSCATATCSRGLTCVATTSMCQPDGAASASCDKDHPCGFGLSCVGAVMTTPGTCQTSGKTVGAACDPKRLTAPACDANQGLGCDSATKQCVALTYASDGMPCGLVGTTVTACSGTATCYGASGATPGMCKAAAKDGAACDTDVGPGCLPTARCVTGSATVAAGTCQLVDPTACK